MITDKNLDKAKTLIIRHKEHFTKEDYVKFLELLIKKERWGTASSLITNNKEHFTEEDYVKFFNLLIKNEEWWHAYYFLNNC